MFILQFLDKVLGILFPSLNESKNSNIFLGCHQSLDTQTPASAPLSPQPPPSPPHQNVFGTSHTCFPIPCFTQKSFRICNKIFSLSFVIFTLSKDKVFPSRALLKISLSSLSTEEFVYTFIQKQAKTYLSKHNENNALKNSGFKGSFNQQGDRLLH